jgi:hypothetical protein
MDEPESETAAEASAAEPVAMKPRLVNDEICCLPITGLLLFSDHFKIHSIV